MKIAVLKLKMEQGWRSHMRLYQDKQFQEWKLQSYLQWARRHFVLQLLVSTIWMIIRCLCAIELSQFQIALCAGVTSNILILVIYKKQNHSRNIVELLSMVHQLIVNGFLVILVSINQSMTLCLVIFNVYYLSLYRSIALKVVTLCQYLTFIVIFYDNWTYESIISCAIISIVIIIQIEIKEMGNYSKLNGLFMIIDSIPNPMCIVNKDKKQLLFSNKFFDTLAHTLESTQADSGHSSPDKNPKSNHLNFLQKLELTPFKDEENNFFDIFDADDDEQYKLKNVLYNKQKRSSHEFEIPAKTDMYNSTKEFFSLFRQDREITRQTFTSDITAQIELRHKPQLSITSAKKKRKQSFPVHHSTNNQRQSISEHVINVKRHNSQNEDDNFVMHNHKMKFLVHVMDKYKIVDDIEDIQIYFIHQLSPVLLRNKIKKLESVKKNLLRSISHELLNTLNATLQHIKQTQDELKGVFPKSLWLAENYAKLQELKIYDFFDYRDLLEDKLILKRDPVNINEVIIECVQLFQHDIESKNLTLYLDLTDKQYVVLGDKQRFMQIFANLLSNSLKYTSEGHIKILIEKKQYHSMDGIHEEEGEIMLEIHVQDTGCGMNTEEMRNLQTKLRNMGEEDKISKNSVGIGVGLSVCKQIIRVLGNQTSSLLYVQSEPNKGSDFFFNINYLREIDCASIEAMAYEARPQQIRSFTQQWRRCSCNCVLIVDDESFNVDVHKRRVETMGYQTQIAFNGLQAIQKYQTRYLINYKRFENRCKPQCSLFKAILMDIQMPILDGLQAVRKLRELELQYQLQALPIYAVTAFCTPEDDKNAVDAGFTGAIRKPITQQQLNDIFAQI